MTQSTHDTSQLLQNAKEGDQRSRDELLARHRLRLRKMVSLRMDARVRQRCGPSDVIQETMIEAARKLPDYLESQPLPFYPWLRQIAWENIVDLHRRHFALQRTVASEEQWQPTAETVTTLAGRLAAGSGGPGSQAVRKELAARVRSALEQLTDADRDLLLMRYAEQLKVKEISALLSLSEPAVKSRVRGALERLNQNLSVD